MRTWAGGPNQSLPGPGLPLPRIHRIPPFLVGWRVFHPSSQPSQCQFSPDTTDLELVRFHRFRAQPHKAIPTSGTRHKSRSLPVFLTSQLY